MAKIIIDTEDLQDIIAGAIEQVLNKAQTLPDETTAKHVLNKLQVIRESAGERFRTRIGKRAACNVMTANGSYLDALLEVNSFDKPSKQGVKQTEKVSLPKDDGEDVY